MAVPSDYRPRRAGADRYEVHQMRIIDDMRDEFQGIPVVAPETAIAQSIDWGIARDMIEQAVTHALAQELIGSHTARQLRETLAKRSGGTDLNAAAQ